MNVTESFDINVKSRTSNETNSTYKLYTKFTKEGD